MKRTAIVLCVALACVGIGWAGYRASAPSMSPMSKYVPAGPLLYLESKDFSSLLSDWNSSAQKRQWIQSSSNGVFSRSRLFLRLKGASDQFAATDESEKRLHCCCSESTASSVQRNSSR